MSALALAFTAWSMSRPTKARTVVSMAPPKVTNKPRTKTATRSPWASPMEPTIGVHSRAPPAYQSSDQAKAWERRRGGATRATMVW